MKLLDIVTIIGGVGGYIALVVSVIQWYYYVYKQTPRLRFLNETTFKSKIIYNDFMISVPIIIENSRPVEAIIIEINGEVISKRSSENASFQKGLEFIGSRIELTKKGLTNENVVSVRDRPYLHVDSYDYVFAWINFAPAGGAKLPATFSGNLHIRYRILSRIKEGKLKIKFRAQVSKE